MVARTGKAKQGTRGLSLFVVPKYLLDEDGAPGERNDVDLVGINHKMGYRGTVNTALTFGSGAHSPRSGVGAVGFIVGEEGQGLAQMFHMMNEARIAVGAGAAALGYTGYLHALDTHAIPPRPGWTCCARRLRPWHLPGEHLQGRSPDSGARAGDHDDLPLEPTRQCASSAWWAGRSGEVFDASPSGKDPTFDLLEGLPPPRRDR